MARTITVQIPTGADPGDTLTFILDGVELEFPVPHGSVAGDTFQIQVASTSGDEDEDENDDNDNDEDETDVNLSDYETRTTATAEQEGIITVPLTNGTILTLATTITAAATTSTKANDLDLDSNDNDNDGTHAMAWPAGLAMAQDMEQLISTLQILQPKRILELGSGLGLVGLAYYHYAADSRNRNNDTFTLVLTDVALPLLELNVAQNTTAHGHLNNSARIECQVLKWGNNNKNNILPHSFDLLLASDVLYNVDSIPALVETIHSTLVLQGGTILLAVRWRKPHLEREFFQQTTTICGIEWKVHPYNEGSFCNHHLSWHEYGNPNSVAFHLYFSQTMVAVQGTPMTLAEIDETHTERMTEDEYQAWEQAQLQMYVGTR